MSINPNLDKWRQMPQREPDPKTVCNFCKQTPAEDKLIAGPGVNICTECVELCNEIIADQQAEYRKKVIEEMATVLCVKEETLTAERAIVMATCVFDAGYRREEN